MIPIECMDCLNRQMPMSPLLPFTPGHAPSVMPPVMMPPMPMPSGTTTGMQLPSANLPKPAPGTTMAPPTQTPPTFEMAPGAPVQKDINYTQGYLRTQIGKRMLVSFLIGTNTYQDRTGTLERVGISYIILREPEGTQLLCDIYSIKFVRIF